MFTHQLGTFHRHVEIATQIHVDSLVEGIYRGIQNMAEERISGSVIHKDVQLAVHVTDMGKHCFNLCQFTHMAGKGFRAAAVCLNGISNRLTAINLAAGHNHMGALLCQQTGNFFANTPACTGDQGNLALKVKKLGTHYDSPD